MAQETCECCNWLFVSNKHQNGVTTSLDETSVAGCPAEFCKFIILAVKELDGIDVVQSPLEISMTEQRSIFMKGQWEGASDIQIQADDTDIHQHLDYRIVRPEISAQTANSIIQEWLNSCTTKHHSCAHSVLPQSRAATPDIAERCREEEEAVEIPSLPRRLIDIDKKIKLVDTPTNEPVEYVALSYCWGQAGEYNVPKFDNGTQRTFRYKDLPQTLQDAIDLTRLIKEKYRGVKYLWVDSICIDQGSESDWELESMKMGSIYSNAFLVISATASARVGGGLFTRRSLGPTEDKSIRATVSSSDQIQRSVYARRALSHEIITSCRTKPFREWEKSIRFTFPLLSRGWAFQERLLATRMVHFTRSELVWECIEDRWCECGRLQSSGNPSRNNLSAAFQFCLRNPTQEIVRQMWREITKSYSRRRLTEKNDRLPAISAVAQLLAPRSIASRSNVSRSNDFYVAGLWRDALPFDLLWRSDQSVSLEMEKSRQPSWSWSSIDSGINWPESQRPSSIIGFISSATNFEEAASGVDVSAVSVKLKGIDTFGGVESGEITLVSRLVPAIVEWAPFQWWWDRYKTRWSVRVNGCKAAPFWPDINLSQEPKGITHNEFSCVEIMTPNDYKTESWEEGLIVKLKATRNPMNAKKYERIGVAANVSGTGSERWQSTEYWFKGQIPDQVTII